MKMWSKVVAVVGALLLVGVGAGMALASTGVMTIKVNAKPVNFYVNGANETPTGGVFDNQGTKVPDAFIYDGTTYVPVRMVSNLIGQPVQWIGSQYAVAIGKSLTGASLYSLQPYQSSGVETLVTTTMASTTYNDVVQVTNSSVTNPLANYNLNATYATFTFTAGLDDNSPDGATVTITGDGNSLWTHTFNPGDLPVQASIPVSGVNQLQIQVLDSGSTGTAVDFANAQLQP